MPSVIDLPEAWEKKVREEVARLRTALGKAEHALQRLVGARVTVTEVLAERPSVAEKSPLPGAVAGSVVPHRTDGMAASVPAPEYQRIMELLDSGVGREGMRCQQLAAALGLPAMPAKVEGVRSKAKRLVERGWIRQVRPGCSPRCRRPAVVAMRPGAWAGWSRDAREREPAPGPARFPLPLPAPGGRERFAVRRPSTG
ncbi:hypothetical protein ACFV6E_22955 [Streptomyces sp. NPDC059785]|uniref:hypothetical protein n=1 Tax=Streptomyces sp. NPDC059785 TaxID=3346945 RepID=UPI003647520A